MCVFQHANASFYYTADNKLNVSFGTILRGNFYVDRITSRFTPKYFYLYIFNLKSILKFQVLFINKNDCCMLAM